MTGWEKKKNLIFPHRLFENPCFKEHFIFMSISICHLGVIFSLEIETWEGRWQEQRKKLGRLASHLLLFAMGVGIFLSQPAGGLTEIPSSQLPAPADSCGLIPSANTFKELSVDMSGQEDWLSPNTGRL